MFRLTLGVLVLSATVCAADDKENAAKAKALRAEIAKLNRKVAELEKQVLELEDGVRYVGPVKDLGDGKQTLSLKTGERGHFGPHIYRILKVGDDFVDISIGGFTFLISDIPTAGLAEGSTVRMDGQWQIDIVERRGRKVFNVTPADKKANLVAK